MKKLLPLLCLYLAISLPSYAIMTSEDSTSETYLTNHGYSPEMVRLIDLQNAQFNGKAPRYKRKQPDWYTSNKNVSFIRHVFMYFDCGLDDEKFMEHKVRYSPKLDDL